MRTGQLKDWARAGMPREAGLLALEPGAARPVVLTAASQRVAEDTHFSAIISLWEGACFPGSWKLELRRWVWTFRLRSALAVSLLVLSPATP